jgi:hypothetical protein
MRRALWLDGDEMKVTGTGKDGKISERKFVGCSPLVMVVTSA